MPVTTCVDKLPPAAQSLGLAVFNFVFSFGHLSFLENTIWFSAICAKDGAQPDKKKKEKSTPAAKSVSVKAKAKVSANTKAASKGSKPKNDANATEVEEADSVEVLKKPAASVGGMKRPAAPCSQKSVGKAKANAKAKTAPKDVMPPDAAEDVLAKQDMEENEVAEEAPTASKRRKAQTTPKGWGQFCFSHGCHCGARELHSRWAQKSWPNIHVMIGFFSNASTTAMLQA